MSEELTPWQQYKKNLGETRPWDFLDSNTEYVSEEEKNTRIDISDKLGLFSEVEMEYHWRDIGSMQSSCI